jgi:transposase
MPTSSLPYEPDQDLLLPHSLREWLPEDHLAHYISDTIETLDLGAFYERYESGGARNQPFHPAMMVKVLVYGYATGVFSSRKIARKLHEDVAFRLLAAGNFPKHRTISDFRALHLKELAELFVQVVKLAGECGLVRLGTIAVDGTKLKANASGSHGGERAGAGRSGRDCAPRAASGGDPCSASAAAAAPARGGCGAWAQAR